MQTVTLWRSHLQLTCFLTTTDVQFCDRSIQVSHKYTNQYRVKFDRSFQANWSGVVLIKRVSKEGKFYFRNWDISQNWNDKAREQKLEFDIKVYNVKRQNGDN